MISQIYNRLFVKNNSYLVGSASSALYIFIKHMRLANTSIICPSNICYSIPFTILASGNTPVFYDVDKVSGNPDLPCVVKALDFQKNISAIVLPHMYGNISTQRDKIVSHCNQKGILVIEDCAASIGSSTVIDKSKYKSDAIIFSFGENKHVDLGYGGLLATDHSVDINYHEKSMIYSFHTAKIRIDLFDKVYKSILYSDFYYDLLPNLASFADFVKGAFVYKVSWKKDAVKNLLQMLSNLEDRKENSLKLMDKMEDRIEYNCKYFSKYSFNEGSHPWRFNISCVNGTVRNELKNQMLNKGLDISIWYPPIDPIFSQPVKKNANYFSQRIINFNHTKATKAQISNFIKILNSYKSVT